MSNRIAERVESIALVISLIGGVLLVLFYWQ
jgi:hypothetical protein